MKKNNLKRFLASLLAVLMLASVTGVSPAVFAEEVYEQPQFVSEKKKFFSRLTHQTLTPLWARLLSLTGTKLTRTQSTGLMIAQ